MIVVSTSCPGAPRFFKNTIYTQDIRCHLNYSVIFFRRANQGSEFQLNPPF